MRPLAEDLRYALRALAKTPGLAVVAVVTLAVGVGAATAMFTLLDQVVLRPLPIREPDRVVQLRWEGAWTGSNNGYAKWSYPVFEIFHDEAGEVFEDVFARYSMPGSLGYAGETERVGLEIVSGDYFPALGVGAAAGRVLGPADDVHNDGHPVAVLSHAFWRERFEGDPDVIGETVQINGRAFEIVGVAEPGFHGVEFQHVAEVFLPSRMKMAISSGGWAYYNLEDRTRRWIQMFGRLRPGLTAEAAQAALGPLFARIVDEELQVGMRVEMPQYYRDRMREAELVLMPGRQGPRNAREEMETPLWLLMGMSGLLLAIACANVANLLIARAATRRREVAIQLALGVGQGRLMRRLLLESLAIAAAAAGLGLLLAQWATRLLLSLLPGGAADVQIDASPDPRVLAFTIAAAVATALLFGLAPALRARRVPVAETLKNQGGAIMGGDVGLRKALVGAQVFLSLVLLAGAGLFTHTLLNLKGVDSGYDVAVNLVFGMDPQQAGYTAERQRAMLEQTRDRLRALPGVEAVGMSVVRVLDGNNWTNTISVAGYESKDGENMNVHFNAVSPGYFAALGVPILQGRDIAPTDSAETPEVAVVNQAFVDYFYQDGSPLGRRFHMGGPNEEDPGIEIIGVVPNLRYEDMREDVPRQMFIPYDQLQYPSEAHTYVRVSGDPTAVAGAVRQTLREIDPMLPLYDFQTMARQLDESLTAERLIAFLAAAFGLTAAALCAVGLYGVLAYSVTRRTKEIGLRLALGATPGDVRRLVAGEGLKLFAIAAVLALPTAFGVARLVESQLYGVTPYDPLTLIAATTLLGGVAWLAGWGPARRAARTEPMQALRFE